MICCFETAKETVYQAREIGIALPNEWVADPNNVTEEQRLSVKTHVRNMVCNIFGQDKYERNEVDFHAHYNSKGNNLHVHIVYTDRQWQDINPIVIGQYDRDIYHTVDGKVAKRKADRAVDVGGNFLPPVHKKGDNIIKRNSDSVLSSRNKFYGERKWLAGTKQKTKKYFEDNGVEVMPPHPLKEEHEGKGNGKWTILRREHNARVRELNRQIEKNQHKEYDIVRLQRDLNGEKYLVMPDLEDYYLGRNFDIDLSFDDDLGIEDCEETGASPEPNTPPKVVEEYVPNLPVPVSVSEAKVIPVPTPVADNPGVKEDCYPERNFDIDLSFDDDDLEVPPSKVIKTEAESTADTQYIPDCRLQESFYDSLLSGFHSPEFDKLDDIVSDSLNSVPNVNSELFVPALEPETSPEVVEEYVAKQKKKPAPASEPEQEVIPVTAPVIEEPDVPQISKAIQSDIYSGEHSEALSKKVEAAKLEAVLEKERKEKLLFAESDKMVVGGGDSQTQVNEQVNDWEMDG
jgi:hypothetical protein